LPHSGDRWLRAGHSALIAGGTFEAGVAEFYTPGALGAALSNLALWNLAIETGATLNVSEDDAIFNHHFASLAAGVMAELPADWDFILWGWNFDSYLLFDLLPDISPCLSCSDEEQMRAGVDAFQSRVITPQPFRLQRALGIPSYSISTKGARVLKDACVPLSRIKVFFRPQSPPAELRHRYHDEQCLSPDSSPCELSASRHHLQRGREIHGPSEHALNPNTSHFRSWRVLPTAQPSLATYRNASARSCPCGSASG
jgi:hypothetical protein